MLGTPAQAAELTSWEMAAIVDAALVKGLELATTKPDSSTEDACRWAQRTVWASINAARSPELAPLIWRAKQDEVAMENLGTLQLFLLFMKVAAPGDTTLLVPAEPSWPVPHQVACPVEQRGAAE